MTEGSFGPLSTGGANGNDAGNEDGVASVDGLMEPEALCDTVVATLAEGLFAPS